MSFPNIPDVSPAINIDTGQVINLLLASIAFEELGLSHIINAEAEKIQYVLGTIEGQTPLVIPPTIEDLLEINSSVEQTLKNVIKTEMLLQFKLEDVLDISSTSSTTTTTSSSTTTTTSSSTTTTTTSSSTTTTTTESTTTTTTESTTTTTTESTTTTTTESTTTTTTCDPALAFAVFANRKFVDNSQLTVNSNTQVNGDMVVSHNNNVFHGDTNVVGNFNDSSGGNTFDNLVNPASTVAFKTFDATCLKNSADVIINSNVTIANATDALPFQGKIVWVVGTVKITGDNISITGGGILATDRITVTGNNFTYISTKCFALYSQTDDIRIDGGPYSITGLIYTAADKGDIKFASTEGGNVCGALMSGRDITFTGGSGINSINNTGSCAICPKCNSICPG